MVEKDQQNQKQMFCSWLFKIQTQIRVRCFGVTLNVRFTFKKMSNVDNLRSLMSNEGPQVVGA